MKESSFSPANKSALVASFSFLKTLASASTSSDDLKQDASLVLMVLQADTNCPRKVSEAVVGLENIQKAKPNEILAAILVQFWWLLSDDMLTQSTVCVFLVSSVYALVFGELMQPQEVHPASVIIQLC